MVARLVATLRTPGTKYHRKLSLPATTKTKVKRLSPRQTAMLMARRPEKLNASEKQLIGRLEKCCPAVATLHPLIRSFSTVFQNKDADALQPWIERATSLELPAIKSFCDGLLKDHSSVLAAISLKWSNGRQVEGQVHRLKLIKRQMYGRAGFHLLRARVLPYAPVACQFTQRAP
jgi:transposase